MSWVRCKIELDFRFKRYGFFKIEKCVTYLYAYLISHMINYKNSIQNIGSCIVYECIITSFTNHILALK